MIKFIKTFHFKNFFQSKSAGGIILLICVFISLIIANSGFSEVFHRILSVEIGFTNNLIQLKYPLLLWINDGLMAIFFLLVGLEIKREIFKGELSSVKQASLPVMAACGGALLPALIYTLFNNNTLTEHGWGIPMATDIAFALGVLSLLGNRVPLSLKVFLAALAIVDDLMAILVIAFFYSTAIQLSYLLYAGIIIIALHIFNRLGIKSLVFYIIPGIVVWYLIHHSGIHATIAGVLTAFTIPINGKDNTVSPLEKLEHALVNPVSFIIMPLFALANTNITFENQMIEGITSNLGLGVILGLFLGKPIGILLLSWLSVKLKISRLPNTIGWKHILGVGLLAGIGFTMSIFIALLSFENIHTQNQAKFAILLASLLSGIIGFMFLNKLFKDKSSHHKSI